VRYNEDCDPSFRVEEWRHAFVVKHVNELLVSTGSPPIILTTSAVPDAPDVNGRPNGTHALSRSPSATIISECSHCSIREQVLQINVWRFPFRVFNKLGICSLLEANRNTPENPRSRTVVAHFWNWNSLRTDLLPFMLV